MPTLQGQPVIGQAVAATPAPVLVGTAVIGQAVAAAAYPVLVGASVTGQAVAPAAVTLVGASVIGQAVAPAAASLVGAPVIGQAIANLGSVLKGASVVGQAVGSLGASNLRRLDDVSGTIKREALWYTNPDTGKVMRQALYYVDPVSQSIKVIIGPNDTTTPVPPPVVVKPMMGITESTDANFATINGLVGPVSARRTYSGTLPASWASSGGQADQAAGRTSNWSWHPGGSFATDLAAQNAFSAFLDTIPAGAKVYISAEHEPEDDIVNNAADSTKGFSLAQYGAMINKAGQIVHSKNRPNLQFGPCFQGVWTFDHRSPYWQLDWLSVFDLSAIDFVGLDPYRTSSGTASTWEQMMTVGNSGTSSSVKSTMATMVDWGKPVLLSEFGVFNKPGQTATITEAAKIGFIQGCYSWMKTWNVAHPAGTPGNVIGAIYYNNTLIGSDERLSTAAQQQAYQAIVVDSRS